MCSIATAINRMCITSLDIQSLSTRGWEMKIEAFIIPNTRFKNIARFFPHMVIFQTIIKNVLYFFSFVSYVIDRKKCCLLNFSLFFFCDFSAIIDHQRYRLLSTDIQRVITGSNVWENKNPVK